VPEAVLSPVSARMGALASVNAHGGSPDHACRAQGLRFYLGMHDVERRCRQEAEDFAFTRNVQREELKQVCCNAAAW